LIFSFNCFQNNNTCEIFSKSLDTNSFLLINNTASSLYFISLPTIDSTLEITSTAQTTSELLHVDGTYVCILSFSKDYRRNF
jgi:hypothetical protein